MYAKVEIIYQQKIKRGRIDITMKPTDKNKVTEDEIIRAIRQVGEDAEVIEAFKSVSEQDLRAILQRERNRKPKIKTMRLWLYSVSAAAAVLLLLFVLDIFKTDNTHQELFFASFEMPSAPTIRGTSNFFELYNEELYEEALASIDKENLDPLLKFYVSVILMNRGDMPQAIELLSERLVTATTSFELNRIRWYLALAYLHENEIDRAKELLQSIDSGGYLERARELLRRLK